ncbi:MAG TPA: hypothetical protein VJB57_02275 [Dehalococcoidia bacterium]|nr:hypothetical protein [Dehalococcoidia bacterium]
MLKWNAEWAIGGWRLPKHSPRELVEAYAEQACKTPGVLGVWAAVRGPTLNIYTLVERDGDAEQAAYKIEGDLSDKWAELPVRFHVYRDEASLKEAVQDAEPILVAA